MIPLSHLHQSSRATNLTGHNSTAWCDPLLLNSNVLSPAAGQTNSRCRQGDGVCQKPATADRFNWWRKHQQHQDRHWKNSRSDDWEWLRMTILSWHLCYSFPTRILPFVLLGSMFAHVALSGKGPLASHDFQSSFPITWGPIRPLLLGRPLPFLLVNNFNPYQIPSGMSCSMMKSHSIHQW